MLKIDKKKYVKIKRKTCDDSEKRKESASR